MALMQPPPFQVLRYAKYENPAKKKVDFCGFFNILVQIIFCFS